MTQILGLARDNQNSKLVDGYSKENEASGEALRHVLEVAPLARGTDSVSHWMCMLVGVVGTTDHF